MAEGSHSITAEDSSFLVWHCING